MKKFIVIAGLAVCALTGTGYSQSNSNHSGGGNSPAQNQQIPTPVVNDIYRSLPEAYKCACNLNQGEFLQGYRDGTVIIENLGDGWYRVTAGGIPILTVLDPI